MGKTNVLVHSFSAGEISRAALSRIDQETVRLNAERQENMFPYSVGKAIMRPGTQYIANTYYGPSKIVPFVRSTESTAMIEFGYDASSNPIMRVFVNDVAVTRVAVTSSITNGTFSSASGWTTTLTGGATATFGVSGLVLQAIGTGGKAIADQQVSTSSSGTEHAIRIVVTHGTVTFMCGSTQGSSDYIEQVELGTGYHSLAFTPTGSYWIRFQGQDQTQVIVASAAIEAAGEMTLPGSWTPATMSSIRCAQSIDVMYLAIQSSRQLKIERRGDTSWSIVNYYADDGPFSVAPTASGVMLTPAASIGNTTLTASAPFFQAGHVGAIFAVTHDQMNATYCIGGLSATTPAFRVTGVYHANTGDRLWAFAVSGTWVGRITLERSFNNETSGFEPVVPSGWSGDITANGSGQVNDVDDNAIVWYRFRFSAYTSGAALVSINYGGYGFTGVARVTSYTSSTVVNVEVLSPFANVTASSLWTEGEWSTVQGYPTAVAIYDGRLWWGRDDKVYGSYSDSYDSFAVSSTGTASSTTITGDANSIQRTIATGASVPQVRWFLPLQRLVIGNSGSEASVRASSLDEALTPTNITIKDSSSQGSADVAPIKVDTVGVFVHRSTRKLYAMIYDIYKSDYRAQDLMRVNEELGYPPDLSQTEGFQELAVQRQPETYIWARRSDGIACILIFNPDEKVAGWFRFISGESESDKILSMTVLPGSGEDSVYFVMQRTVGSGTDYYIEKLRTHREALTRVQSGTSFLTYNGIYQVDCHIEFTVSPAGLATLSGLGYLEGRTVMALGYSVTNATYGPLSNGALGTTFTVTGGAITLGELASGTVVVGLPYTGKYKSAKLAYGAQEGTAIIQKKRVMGGGIIMQDTHPDAILMGPDLDDAANMLQMPRVYDGNLVSAITSLDTQFDHQMFPFPAQWTTDARVCVQIQPGYSATLTGLVYGVETNETSPMK
jgi:hypothetical protein